MATIIAAVPSPTNKSAAVPKGTAGLSSPLLGLPRIRPGGGRVRCSSEAKPVPLSGAGMGAALLSAACVMGASSPVLALVDERMSTEGTGLSLGVSNNLLGWILVGVFALIWALFFVYTSTLEEDEDSGLSL
ncbi:hypothetical protein GW17_00006681 [Ensete ventricosum]|nr:hypothetical protein GW17_00006681 [Ensete ventricosum]RZR87042.1 hypothetical protein BHM03_00014351 [Ensete ventricosum]